MKIAVVGAGYVGVSIATALSEIHNVTIVDIAADKVNKINMFQSPVSDALIEKYFLEALNKKRKLMLSATTNWTEIYSEADYVIIATPTNYNNSTNDLDCSIVEEVIKQVLAESDNALIVIKSTVSIGFTQEMCVKYNTDRVVFCPEFLRESKALFDCLHPNRIIVSANESNYDASRTFSEIMLQCTETKDAPIILMGSSEAEAVKLFANTYLAMRVAFFNELDTYAEIKGLDTRQIIDGISLDPRIGGFYNNPSFGYGGYCLTKDSKELLSSFRGISENLISSVVRSNETRKEFIANQIIKQLREISIAKDGHDQQVVGVYRLLMKNESDNFRQSSIQCVMRLLSRSGYEIVIYEPLIGKEKFYQGHRVINDIEEFKTMSSIIVANRYSTELEDVKDRVYTRDIYEIN